MSTPRYTVRSIKGDYWNVLDNNAGTTDDGYVIWTFVERESAEQVAYIKNLVHEGKVTQEKITESFKPKQRWTADDELPYYVFDEETSGSRGFGVGVFEIADEWNDDGVTARKVRDVIVEALNRKLP